MTKIYKLIIFFKEKKTLTRNFTGEDMLVLVEK